MFCNQPPTMETINHYGRNLLVEAGQNLQDVLFRGGQDNNPRALEGFLPTCTNFAIPREIDYIRVGDHGKAFIERRASAGGGYFISERRFTAFILDDLVKLPDLLRHLAKHASMDNDEIDEIVFTNANFPSRTILVEGDKNTAIHDWKIMAFLSRLLRL